MARQEMPKAEVEITVDLAHALLCEQHPDLSRLDISLVANGWDNCMFRLGDDLALRLPRRALAAPLIANEQQWLWRIAGGLPLRIPVPLRVGKPSADFPWAWSVTPWFEGSSLAAEPPVDQGHTALQVAGFLKALHTTAPSDAPKNPWRGIALGERDATTIAHIDHAADAIDAVAAAQVWGVLRDAMPWDGLPLWLHGDFHPGNIIATDGEITAVIDFGDITAGDPATDLSVAWMLLDTEYRSEFRASYGEVSDATWSRAKGWALAVGVACIANSSDNPTIAKVGFDTYRRVMSDV